MSLGVFQVLPDNDWQPPKPLAFTEYRSKYTPGWTGESGDWTDWLPITDMLLSAARPNDCWELEFR